MHARTTRALGLAVAGLAAGCVLGTQAAAQGTTQSGRGGAGGAPAQGGGVQTTFSFRTRGEHWDWFDAPDGDAHYTYLGTIARLGVSGRAPGLQWTVEGAAPILLGLPAGSVAPAPRGALGLGANYWAANGRREHVANVFVKQAFVRLGAPATRGGQALRLGRFEFAEGAELTPSNGTLAALKRDRIAQRLVGPFAWTHVGRAFDGAHYTWDRRARPGGPGAVNVTAAAFFPTEGAFRTSAWRPLDIAVGYLAYSRDVRWRGGQASDLRTFVLHYDDMRDEARGLKVDNRPAALRAADRGPLRVTTLGAHLLHTVPSAVGPFDALAWGALQAGACGALDHRAGGAALEAGWQPAGVPWRPWLRVTWFAGSGDRDPGDRTHGTFFEVLPTPRPFARFPLHNLMNIEQTAGTLLLRPSTRLTLRSDLNALRLHEVRDLWYAGGGAFERGSFGYAGRPGAGRRGLATLADLSADLTVTRHANVNAYVARAASGAVTRAIYPGTGPAWFGYVELNLRY